MSQVQRAERREQSEKFCVQPDKKNAYSLLEVLISITILAVGLVGLSTLTERGQIQSVLSHELTTAQQVCQTRMNEILAGSVPLKTVIAEPIPDLRDWTLSVSLDPMQKLGIVAVAVVAERQWVADQKLRRAGRFRIVQWINTNTPPQPVAISKPQSNNNSFLNNSSNNSNLNPSVGFLPSSTEPEPTSSTDLFPPLPLPDTVPTGSIQ